jgi:hypothetical protein
MVKKWKYNNWMITLDIQRKAALWKARLGQV